MGMFDDLLKTITAPVASLGSGLLGFGGQMLTNQTNVGLGKEQMEFQERMSSTSYQRGVKDMMAAGLNPMLAYSQGGASTPIGSMPQVQNAVSAGVGSAAQTAQAIGAMQSIKQSEAQTDLLAAEAAKVKSTTFAHWVNNARAMTELKKMGVDLDTARAVFDAMNAADRGSDRPGAGFRADVDRRKAEARLSQLMLPEGEAMAKFWSNDFGSASPDIKLVLQMLRGILGAGNSARNIAR